MAKKKTIAELMKEIENLKGEVKDLKSNKTENKTKKTPTWKDVDRKVKKDGSKPVRYFLVQKKGKQTQVVVGPYSNPVVKPRGEIKGEDAGWFKTTTKHYGKKKTAYYIPKKGAVLSKKDAEAILKLF